MYILPIIPYSKEDEKSIIKFSPLPFRKDWINMTLLNNICFIKVRNENQDNILVPSSTYNKTTSCYLGEPMKLGDTKKIIKLSNGKEGAAYLNTSLQSSFLSSVFYSYDLKFSENFYNLNYKNNFTYNFFTHSSLFFTPLKNNYITEHTFNINAGGNSPKLEIISPLLKGGVKITLSGRLKGISKAKKLTLTRGIIRPQCINNKLDYYSRPIFTKWGTIGLKVIC